MGLGLEFNEELLISIADLTKGHAYMVSDPQEIPQVFARELSGVQAVALRNLELKLALVNGVELRRAHRVQPIIAEMSQVRAVGGSANVPLGDLQRNEHQALMLELVAPARPAGSYRLAQLLLAYDNPSQGALGQKERRDLLVEYQDAPLGALDPAVMNVVERISAHTLQTRALQDAQAGNVVGATQKLQQAYTRLLNMGESELADAARQEIDNLQQGGQVSAAGTKRLRYETRRLTGKT
jgi:Ca-activated chloride channel family protein